MQQEPGLTEDERAELKRLRAENAALRSQVRPGGVSAEGRGVALDPVGAGAGARSWPAC
jgi:hypothetical protein